MWVMGAHVAVAVDVSVQAREGRSRRSGLEPAFKGRMCLRTFNDRVMHAC